MNARPTPRERLRAQLVREIKQKARRQLSEVGPQGLSLRAVARDMNMVSSGLYRYFASRDELLTALIVDSYNTLGTWAERALNSDETPPGHRSRWRAVCTAVREWALTYPNEYALIFGTPVPGYSAPVGTITAAIRVPTALFTVVRDAWADGALTPPGPDRPLPPELAGQAHFVTESISPGLPEPLAVRTAAAWTQLFGMVGFELFGHLSGGFDPADAFFGHSVDLMADLLGFPVS
ncbi:putative HTH-type transcriptional regulator [Actinomadura rubteroloni]|uniref:Putative HTH-type transcriptional regulator n=1 Tax=Actinomadura rubteroloni TaxID=1926885 RepID=A0A2P4UNB2_9ACTN|nr:TetR/AcrR family transcriptional regulator [Actinomadura rubteroloni]POM26541.1 putative HTH-type transcriptional regulator [Actinomadura rubteroloni]